jgi:hypothetical protein
MDLCWMNISQQCSRIIMLEMDHQKWDVAMWRLKALCGCLGFEWCACSMAGN